MEIYSKNPLKIPEVLSTVLHLLNLQHLRQCRLVNKLWRDTCLTRVRLLCDKITFVNVGNFNRIPEMNKVTNIIKKSGNKFPCTKFEIFTSIIENPSTDGVVVASFISTVSAIVTELTINYQLGDWIFNAAFPMKFEFFSLKVLELNAMALHCSEVHGLSGDGIVQFVANVIEKSPKLSKIVFPTIDELHPMWIKALGKVSATLAMLRMPIASTDESMQILATMGLRLRSLQLNITNTEASSAGLKNFLGCQATTLRTLHITDWIQDCEFSVEFPCLQKLEVLEIEGGSGRIGSRVMFSNISYKKQFPSLKRLSFARSVNSWRDFLEVPTASQGLPSLEEIRFSRLFTEAGSLGKAAKLFPNLTRVDIPVITENVITDIWRFLPDLEELILDTSRVDLIDHILMGVSVESCKNFYSGEECSGAFDEKSIGSVSQSLLSLKNLKTLRMRALGSWKPIEVTSLSCSHVLTKMDSLRLVDFYGRDPTAKSMIPADILEQMMKKIQVI